MSVNFPSLGPTLATTDVKPPLDLSLVLSNVEALREGAELIRLLESGDYTSNCQPTFQSTIGAHFRHILEHYGCFLRQLETGLINYDKRERQRTLECESSTALQTIEDCIQGLLALERRSLMPALRIEDEQTSQPLETSINRELLFLQSHTVHHFAIIGAMSRLVGKQPQDDFGVAIATRAFNQCQQGSDVDQSNDQQASDHASKAKSKDAACAR